MSESTKQVAAAVPHKKPAYLQYVFGGSAG